VLLWFISRAAVLLLPFFKHDLLPSFLANETYFHDDEQCPGLGQIHIALLFASIMVDGSDVEILVHTTAPSRGPDDARYRALAHAYLNFQPATKQKIELDIPTGVEEEPGSQLLGELNQSTQEERESEASYRPDEEEETGPSRVSVPYNPEHIPGFSQSLSSPGLSFTSVLESPVFRPPITWHQPSSQSESGSQPQQSEVVWPDAPSTVADSQPENDRTMIARASPATILELRLQQMDTSEETSIAATASQRSTHPSSQSTGNEAGVAVVPVIPLLPTLPLPISESSNMREPEIQVARTSSADERLPGRSEAHHSPPTIQTPYDSRQTTTSSGSAIPATPTPARPQKARGSRPTQSSSPSLGSLVPVTSTPPVVSSSGHEMTTDKSNPGVNADPKPDTLVAAKRNGPRTPLPNGKLKPVGMGSQKAIPKTATASLLSGPTKPDEPEAQYKPASRLPNDHPSATQERDPQSSRKSPDITSASQHMASSTLVSPLSKSVPKKPKRQKKVRTELNSSQSATESYQIPISDSAEASMSKSKSQPLYPWDDKLEMRPPMPAASTARLKILWPITQDLASLAEEYSTRPVFLPESRARDLRESERGYWRVNSETWDSKVKVEVWRRLGDFIGKGRAGWGCSCIRFEDSAELRVYCPGNLVGHIYMVLDMATWGKIKGSGACWIGGDGEPLIKMA